MFTGFHPEQPFLFSWMKKVRKGKCCAGVEEVKEKTAEALKGIKTDKLKSYLKPWKDCLVRCIASNGEYSEGD